MKKFFALALAVLMLASLAACGGGEASEESAASSQGETPEALAAGTYEIVKIKFVGDTEWTEDEEGSIVLNADGTGKFNRDGESFNLTWTLDGETFAMTETFLGIKNEYTGTLKNGALDIFNGDPASDLTCEYVLEKK